MMRDTMTVHEAPGIVPALGRERDRISDDECLRRLAAAIESHDDRRLPEVAWLLGRLTAPIE